MKEEELKKVISKSTVETSNDFINDLMSVIEMQETKKAPLWWSFRTILMICSILTLMITGLLFILLNTENSFLISLTDIPKTPLFLVVTCTLLYYINSIIKLNHRNIKNNMT